MPTRRLGLKAALSVLVVMVLVLSSLPAMAKVGETYYCAVTGLTVHSKANTRSAALGTLSLSDKVVHVSTKNGMWRIRAKGGEGFVKPKNKKGDRNLVLQPYEKNGVYVVKGTKRLALRESPDKGATVQGVVKRYGAVKLTQLDGYWGYVTSQDGIRGWVRMKFLRPV